jgi:hypothetical protein
MSNLDQGQNYSLFLRDVVREQWAHAELSLTDLKPNRWDDKPMVDGDRLRTLLVEGGRPGGTPFYVDNLRIEERPVGPLPRSTAGGLPPAPR